MVSSIKFGTILLGVSVAVAGAFAAPVAILLESTGWDAEEDRVL
jgi:hypothetical protein